MDQPPEAIGRVDFKGCRSIAAKVFFLLVVSAFGFVVVGFSSRNGLTKAADTGTVVKTKLETNGTRSSTRTVQNITKPVGIGVTGTKRTTGKDRTANKITTMDSDSSLRGRLVISMKTMPSRIHYIQPVLDSLILHQTHPFDEFYLVLPEQPAGSPQYEIPSFVQNYSNHGHLTILRPNHDLGAIDKMIHTLPVEESIFRKQSALQAHQFRILYLDDDMIYDKRHVEILVQKSDQYPSDVVALSGGKLRSHFRQIEHTNPKKDRHPYMYFWVGGLDSHGDPPVDIVQGFMAVMIRLSFFDVPGFVRLGSNTSIPNGVRRDDDFIICGYLEMRNVTRRLVDGGLTPVTNPKPAHIDNLGSTMHRNAMTAASYLQREWGIWSQYKFEPYLELPKEVLDLIDCEAHKTQFCPADVKDARGKPIMADVTELLDSVFNVSSN